MLRSLIAGMRALLRPAERNAQIEEELKSFFDASVEEKIRNGMSPESARRAAQVEIGSRETVRHKTWSASWESRADSFVRELRFATRQLRKSPGYAAVTMLTLALGIGANTAIFLLTYTLLLKSLPVPDPGRLVRYSFNTDTIPWMGIDYPLYEALRAHQGPTSGLFAWNDNHATLREDGRSSQVPVALATGSVFRVLELHPYLGRGFEENAGERGQPLEHEVLLSYDYWKSHFGGDPDILGRAIDLNHTEMMIVGVLPRGFEGISPENRDDVLLPLSFEKVMDGKDAMIDEAGAFWLTVMGRMKPGATLAEARAALNASSHLIVRDADPQHKVFGSTLFGSKHWWLGVISGRTGRSWLRHTYIRPLAALEALCGLMMLLCAVNVALLVLSRVSGRLHEFAVRSALGAARGRLMRQVLMESALLGAGGLLLGGWLGWELSHGLVAMITSVGEPPALDLKAGATVMLFAVGLSLGAALLAGLWPAWRASRTAPALDLKQARTQSRSDRMGRWIVPTQVALGMVLIYAAVLMTGTLRSYLKESSGFEPQGVTLAELNYQNNDAEDQGQVRKAYELAEALRHQPGVGSASLMSAPPVSDWMMTYDFFSRDARDEVHLDESIWREEVSEGYFATMGTRILDGRAFDQGDIGGDKVCVISRAAADFFFPGENPIGRFITSGDGKPPKEKGLDYRAPVTYRVIGVAENARMQSLLKPAPKALYMLYEQDGKPFVPGYLGVRASSDGLAAEAIRRTVEQILPGATAPRIYTLDRVVNDDLSQQRLLSSVSGGFALLALALVGAGLYGVLSRAVTERRREIGIRMALGAERRRIVATLAQSAAVRIGIGVAAGTALAALTGRLMRSLLYGVTAADPLVALMTLALLVVVLVTAFVVPAGRAVSIQPMEAIRDE
ncbi:MAG: ADOP family duplicated permease [Acidobacteriaceae bacterium]